ncbi:hypothetical protein ACFU7Y_40680 [Kitasatospora sp. NPDC057542]|uniref:hypothetical protein n=1 Tax=Kitasatospora sp. NPDC057542 TaxID=3346162 RepID=UPI0036790EF0
MGLLLAVAVGPATADPHAWSAAVGLGEVGWAAAAGYGMDLRRLVVADTLGSHYADVVASLAAACPVVLAAAPSRGLAPRAVDRLVGHLRRAGTVLITPGPWPGAHLRLDVTARHWSGVHDGWGQLERRHVRVESPRPGLGGASVLCRAVAPGRHGRRRGGDGVHSPRGDAQRRWHGRRGGMTALSAEPACRAAPGPL